MPPAQEPMRSGLPPQKEPAGPIAGIVIIVILAIFGALYFWGALLNKQNGQAIQLPLITGDISTTTY